MEKPRWDIGGQAIENVYTSLINDNDGIDETLAALKTELKKSGEKHAIFTKPLPINNREGRKRLQSYAKKRGVIIKFSS